MAHSFKDTAGRRWSIAINVGSIKRVKSLAGVDLLAGLSDGLVQKLSDDPVQLVDVLYALVKPDADAENVTDEQFGSSLAGDVIAEATEAFVEELCDFFPNPRRQMLRKALGMVKESQAELMTLADQAMEAEIKRTLAEARGKLSIALPGAAASTPRRSRFAS